MFRISQVIGYETTANSIAYGLIALALHQDIQDEVIKEVDAVMTEVEQDGRTTLSYGKDFEKLEYMYGFMVSKTRLSLRSVDLNMNNMDSSTKSSVSTLESHSSLRW
jgi:hypothetical protein